MKQDISKIIETYVDLLMPELTPYEASLYFYFLWNSHLKNNSSEIRIGKRTIAENFGKGSRGAKTNYNHITKLLKSLEEKGCIRSGDTNREGTHYRISLPDEIPLIKEKLSLAQVDSDEDYFTNEARRLEIFERDKWICFYCGEKVTTQNATLDHFIPQHKGGTNRKDNLKTSCHICNSIKSGKSYDEAAPFMAAS